MRCKSDVLKYQSMWVSQQGNPCLTHAIRNDSLRSVLFLKYSGVHITSYIFWITLSVQLITLTACLVILNIIFPLLQHPPPRVFLCTTLVQNKLEHGSSIQDPGQEMLICTLESAQNRSAHFNYHQTSGITPLKSIMSLLVTETA